MESDVLLTFSNILLSYLWHLNVNPLLNFEVRLKRTKSLCLVGFPSANLLSSCLVKDFDAPYLFICRILNFHIYLTLTMDLAIFEIGCRMEDFS